MSFEQNIGSLVIGMCADPASAATSTGNLDSGWIYGTSGECLFLRFSASRAQTSGSFTLYAYCTALTGSPTFKLELRNGPSGTDDADNPDTDDAVLATSANVSPTVSRWATFSLSGVTLTEGATYFAIVYNSSADPASNHAAFQYVGECGSPAGLPAVSTQCSYSFAGGTSVNGFTGAAPTIATSSFASMVVKYNDGTIIGNPYVASEAHANNANDRGNRISFDEQVSVCGVVFVVIGTSQTGVEINAGASNIKTVATDRGTTNRLGGTLFSPVTLNKDTEYDFVRTFSGSTTAGTVYNMGEIEANVPADVLASRPGNIGGFVTGASPGSYTLDTSKLYSIVIFLSGPVEQTGGGSGRPEIRGGNL